LAKPPAEILLSNCAAALDPPPGLIRRFLTDHSIRFSADAQDKPSELLVFADFLGSRAV
jgi:hypothetical protein